jgi:hypothetical protein
VVGVPGRRQFPAAEQIPERIVAKHFPDLSGEILVHQEAVSEIDAGQAGVAQLEGGKSYNEEGRGGAGSADAFKEASNAVCERKRKRGRGRRERVIRPGGCGHERANYLRGREVFNPNLRFGVGIMPGISRKDPRPSHYIPLEMLPPCERFER